MVATNGDAQLAGTLVAVNHLYTPASSQPPVCTAVDSAAISPRVALGRVPLDWRRDLPVVPPRVGLAMQSRGVGDHFEVTISFSAIALLALALVAPASVSAAPQSNLLSNVP